jgi:hypothetical protein
MASEIKRHADAAASLRYAASVRARTRQAALAPSAALVGVGTVIAVHASLGALWPHDAAIAASWLMAVIVARPVVRRRRLRRVVAAPRLRLAVAAAAVAGLALALAVGASPLLSSVAAGTAVAAYLAGIPTVAFAAAATGAVGDVLLRSPAPRTTSELLVGATLVVVGLACRAVEREP